MPFVYSEEAVDTVCNLLTAERLTAYQAASKGNKKLALHLYEYNTVVAECVHGLIQPIEIALRNSIHLTLTRELSNAQWFDSISLDPPEQEAVREAKEALTRWNKQVTPGRVIAELTFGFWVRVVSRRYEKMLWVPYLYKCFPHLPRPDRKTVFARFDSIRMLRNRVAHHEPLLARNLKQDYLDIIEALTWICPVTASWIEATCSFHRRMLWR